MLQKMRAYQLFESTDLRMVGKRIQNDIESQLLVLQTPFGYRRVAELFRPAREDAFAAILYSHWYEPESGSSNRSQFVEEARELVSAGAVCLLIETLWSDPDFFMKRTQNDDVQNSIEEVVNTRRAIDVLLSQHNVDPSRFALVGHDFGGMYGTLTGSIDQRPTHYVLMAATPRFSDWYLYAPRLEGDARERSSAKCQRLIQSLIFKAFRRHQYFSSSRQMIRMFPEKVPKNFSRLRLNQKR